MSSLRPRLVHSCAQPAAPSGQTSCPNRLDVPPGGRGWERRGQRGRDVGFYLRRNMPALWGRYVRGTFASREDCAAHFGVAFQTACNWWDDLHAPAAAVFARATIEDGAALHKIMTGQV